MPFYKITSSVYGFSLPAITFLLFFKLVCTADLSVLDTENVPTSRKNLQPLDSLESLPVKNGGWIVIQRRGFSDDYLREDFNRSFGEYENGFGDYDGDFWIGLKVISQLTSTLGVSELKIILWDWAGQQRYAKYGAFTVDDASEGYRIKVAGYSGTAGDSLGGHNNARFTTYASDNDLWRNGNCANKYEGGWWFANCLKSNLNGVYKTSRVTEYGKGIQWLDFRGHFYSLKSCEMMIRLPRD